MEIFFLLALLADYLQSPTFKFALSKNYNYLNIRGLPKGLGKFFMGFWKSPGFFCQ